MLENIVEKEGLNEVNDKTKISKKNLQKLMAKDFEGFSKAKAHGFLAILRREYKDSFDDLDDAIGQWYKEHDMPKDNLFVAAEKESKNGYKTWIVLIFLIAAVFVAFIVMRTENVVKPLNDNTQALQIQHTPSPVAKISPKEDNDSNATSAAENKNTAMDLNEANSSIKSSQKVVVHNIQKPYVAMEDILLTPVIKLWFGIVNMKSGKRVQKVMADPYDIDPKGKKLLVTGHGNFELSDAFGNLIKHKDPHKHYFLIDNGMVKEINASGFKKLNGGKGW